MRNLPMHTFPTYTFWARPNGITPADPSKIAPPPALWPKHAATANSLPERFCSIPPAATPASPTPCSAPLSDSPSRSAFERKRILQAYGANIIYTDPAEGSDGAIKVARQYAERDPDLYFYADQYSNDANWRAHYETTANEIWQQTEGRVTHFVAMLGTTGTFVGTTRRLKELNPTIRCISLQPDSAFHGIEGAKHLPSAIMPRIYDASVADENLEIATEDAHAMARRLAREQGLLVGVSAAAAVVGSLQVIDRLKTDRLKGERRKADRLEEDLRATIVTILCDSGEKYLSERFWNEE